MASVAVESSYVTKAIAKGAGPIADLALGTIGGTLLTGGVQIQLIQQSPGYVVGMPS